jgi:hypothetical protein
MKKFFTFQMNPSNTMEEHLNKLGAIVEELDAIGVPILVKVKVIFMNLFESYQFFVTSPKLLKVHQSCKSKLGGHSNEIAK